MWRRAAVALTPGVRGGLLAPRLLQGYLLQRAFNPVPTNFLPLYVRAFSAPQVARDNEEAAKRSLLSIYASAEGQQAIGNEVANSPKVRVPIIDEFNRSYGTGGRKRASARVWIKPGDGTFVVNHKPHTEYFPRWAHRAELMIPFEITNTLGTFDVWATVKGGGCTGQAQAIRLGIAKALQARDPAKFRPALKQVKLLTRDPRKVERKKYGLRKARKARTWVKR